MSNDTIIGEKKGLRPVLFVYGLVTITTKYRILVSGDRSAAWTASHQSDY